MPATNPGCCRPAGLDRLRHGWPPVLGARRTEAALPRFLAHDRTADATGELYLSPSQQGPDPLGKELRTLTGPPEVAWAGRMRVAIVSSPDPASPTGRRRDLGLLPMDAGGSQIFGRPIVVAGRLPDERQADEAVIDEELAARRHLVVGSRWRVGAYTAAQLEQAAGETSAPPAGPAVNLRIVGIVRHPFTCCRRSSAKTTSTSTAATCASRRRTGSAMGPIWPAMAWPSAWSSIAGRPTWVVADQLGVVSAPVVPSLQALAVAGGAVVVANLIAIGPGWAAGRLRPAIVLRSE